MLVFTKTKTESGTNSKFVKRIYILVVLAAIFIFSGCYEIKTINQSTTVEAGSQITSSFSVVLDLNSSAGERNGIVGLMVPNDWSVDTVSLSGFYSGNCTYLPQGTPDADTSSVADIDYWTDSLETHFPSGEDMQWLVFQTDSSYQASDAADSVIVTVKMTVGETEGEFGLGYFVSDAKGDFSSEEAYSDSLNNMITVIPALDSYEIKTIDQVTTAEASSQITSTFSVELGLTSHAEERYGIIGLLVPTDWTVDSVGVDGYFTSNFTNLPQGTEDTDPSGLITDWTDSLEAHYSSGDDMQWLVFQSDSAYTAESDVTDNITATVKMTVGETEGEFGLGYFVSYTKADFSSVTTYDDSLDNSITITPMTDVEDFDSSVPTDFAISQNYPNPFNPTTTINFSLPVASNVVMTLYNILGAKVMTITNAQYQAGTHQISFDASELASGTYIYSITASGKDGNQFTASKKMVLLK